MVAARPAELRTNLHLVVHSVEQAAAEFSPVVAKFTPSVYCIILQVEGLGTEGRILVSTVNHS